MYCDIEMFTVSHKYYAACILLQNYSYACLYMYRGSLLTCMHGLTH